MLKLNSKKSENKFKILSSPIVVVLSAPSGAGKTTVVTELLKKEKALKKTISHTTRKIRPGEKDKKDYYFISHDAFDRMVSAGEFIEWANVYGEKYGTSRRTIDKILEEKKNPILIIEEQGARNIKRLFPDNSVFVVLLPPSMKELKSRIMRRQGMTKQETENRLNLAWHELQSMQWYDYVFINQDVKKTVAQLIEMLHTEQHRLTRCEKLDS